MLTAKQIESTKPKQKMYRLFDGVGFYLEIDPNGGMYIHALVVVMRAKAGKFSIQTSTPYRDTIY